MTIELGFDSSKVSSGPRFSKGKTVEPEDLSPLARKTLQNAKNDIIEEEKAYSGHSKNSKSNQDSSNTSNLSQASRRDTLDPMIWKIFQ